MDMGVGPRLFPHSLSLLMLLPPQIKVKRRGDDQKFLARVLAIGVECDMALLTGEGSGLKGERQRRDRAAA